MRARASMLIGLAACLLVLAGCATRIHIAVAGPARRAMNPMSTAVRLHPRGPETARRGAANVVVVTTSVDLQRVVTSRGFDHVYYLLSACSRTGGGEGLPAYVYVVPRSVEGGHPAAREAATLPDGSVPARESSGMHIYELFLPT